jgi:hypothetical protein
MKNRKASDTVPCNQRPGNVILAVECVVLERNVLSWSTRMKKNIKTSKMALPPRTWTSNVSFVKFVTASKPYS